MIRNVKPTRMELLKNRKKIALAKKGHKLLKEKRDALFNEFYSQMKPALEQRQKISGEMEEAFSQLSISMTQLGQMKVIENAVSASQGESFSIIIKNRNVMGAIIPEIEHSGAKRSILERNYSITSTSSSLDDSASMFESAVESIVELGQKEAVLARLALEIFKTKRKVNSLEKVTIPKLEATGKYIKQRLEERERETFFTLKKVKAKKEARQAKL